MQRVRSVGWVLPALLTVVFLTVLGVGTSLSQEEGEDVCAGYEGAAGSYCHAYCEELNCDEAPTDAEKCEYCLDRFIEETGEVPPCEPPAEEG